MTLNNREIQSSSNQSVLFDSTEEPPEIINYECLYKNLLKDHNKLKTDLRMQENELISVKNLNNTLLKSNESLRSKISEIHKDVNLLSIIMINQNSLIKEFKKSSVNLITRSIENEAKKYLSTVFSQNQIDLIMKKKKKVHWSRDEISKALTLRYFSKRAYIYVKNELNYPLPGK
jgi:sugar-specific transcriptional regulator TrmB